MLRLYYKPSQKRGGSVVCMSEDEVFGLAVHYYDEDNIKVNKQSKSKVVVPKQPEKQKELTLTAEKSKLEQVALTNVKGRKRKYHQDNFYYLRTYETKNSITETGCKVEC